MAHFIFESGALFDYHDAMDERAFAYGDGFFSTIGVHQGRMLFADGHRMRIVRSAKQFDLAVDVDGVMLTLVDLAGRMQEGVIKIIISRQNQGVRGYGYENEKACVFIKTMLSNIYQGVRFHAGIPCQSSAKAVCLSESLSLRTPRFQGVKLISSHEQVFIHRQLLQYQQKNKSVAEGLVANLLGDWVGGAMSNVFYHLDGAWHTPPVHECGVAGVMRQELMTRFDIKERRLVTDELVCLDGLAFTNAVRGIMPISVFALNGTIRALTQDFCALPKHADGENLS
ncbi:aminotransferase class IV [Moraxella oculi]|uniref:branched-chain-amino-acid transaminase n=1 Tax=Moraxella oculi TaxID=2940516 RepID=A0ABW8U6P8_9GAMM